MSRARERSLVRSNLVSNNDFVPGHNIMQIDSRAWDPNWAYRRRYNALGLAMTYLTGDRHKAFTIASNESYRWGRDRTPAGVLLKFSDMTPSAIIQKLEYWVRYVSTQLANIPPAVAAGNLQQAVSSFVNIVDPTGTSTRPASPS